MDSSDAGDDDDEDSGDSVESCRSACGRPSGDRPRRRSPGRRPRRRRHLRVPPPSILASCPAARRTTRPCPHPRRVPPFVRPYLLYLHVRRSRRRAAGVHEAGVHQPRAASPSYQPPPPPRRRHPRRPRPLVAACVRGEQFRHDVLHLIPRHLPLRGGLLDMLRCRLCPFFAASTSRAVIRGPSSPPIISRSSTGDAVRPNRAAPVQRGSSRPFSVDDDGVRSGHDAVRTSRGEGRGAPGLPTSRCSNVAYDSTLSALIVDVSSMAHHGGAGAL